MGLSSSSVHSPPRYLLAVLLPLGRRQDKTAVVVLHPGGPSSQVGLGQPVPGGVEGVKIEATLVCKGQARAAVFALCALVVGVHIFCGTSWCQVPPALPPK